MIPILPLTQARADGLVAATVLQALPVSVPSVAYRAPDPHDPGRWRRHDIGGRSWRVAQPVTFTPYAAATPCSARCRFCSETLVEQAGARPASALRPGPNYGAQLARALRQLEGLPLSYSLSGLETTDDPDWMDAMLDALARHAARSPVEQRVLYTNGAGLASAAHGRRVLERLDAFGLDWVELSRHHHEAGANQAIMRFRAGVEVQGEQAFAAALAALAQRVPVKLVCIVQEGGVATPGALLAYLDWARRLGASAVIFREFSRLDQRYAANVTARYIGAQRVAMGALLAACLAEPGFARRFEARQVTEGYYFWNLAGSFDGMPIVFEASDYGMMHRQHGSGDVYKLVLHANGNLCAGWNPAQHVLLQGESGAMP